MEDQIVSLSKTFCRCCAKELDEGNLSEIESMNLMPIFHNFFNQILSEKYPKHVCLECSLKMKDFNDFLETCNQIERQLLNCCENNDNYFENSSEVKSGVYSNVDERVKVKHIITNNSFIKFTCNMCDSKFRNWCALSNHTKELHNMSAKVLCICGKYLCTRTAINRHIAKHDTTSGISCNICNKVYLYKKHLEAHIESHKNPSNFAFKCEVCTSILSSNTSLKQHMRVHLPEHLKTRFLCHYCKKRFTTKSTMKEHVNVKHKDTRYICDICGNIYGYKNNLLYHIQSHISISKYTCSICFKSFKTKVKLTRHKDTHDQTSYRCKICVKVLNTKRTLAMHMRNIHSQT